MCECGGGEGTRGEGGRREEESRPRGIRDKENRKQTPKNEKERDKRK